ncbi:hypothetical protein R5R35_012927 [Gryllus longicercus]|uniref:Uncharacterized protein n=1 Tax=Gryllus longicercus TaxID=2509291 RepID=A0AAN9W3Y4_9ORTH
MTQAHIPEAKTRICLRASVAKGGWQIHWLGRSVGAVLVERRRNLLSKGRRAVLGRERWAISRWTPNAFREECRSATFVIGMTSHFNIHYAIDGLKAVVVENKEI